MTKKKSEPCNRCMGSGIEPMRCDVCARLGEDNPCESCVRADMRSVVRRRAATERCVAAWTLSYIHGASISQIAKMLKCTPSAVAYAINRQESSVRHALFRARGEPWMIRLHVAGAIGDWDSRVLQSRAAQDVMDRT